MTDRRASITSLDVMLAADVISGGTIAFTYPFGTTSQDYSAEGAQLASGNTFPTSDFSVALGDSSITVTLLNGLSIPARSIVYLGLRYLPQPLEAEQSLGNVKARAVDKTASFTLSDTDKGAIIYVNNAAPAIVSLPRNWRRGDACLVRKMTANAVSWAPLTGATVVLQASKAGHTQIGEQHAEILLRVVANADGLSAQWSVQGNTA